MSHFKIKLAVPEKLSMEESFQNDVHNFCVQQ